MQTLSLKRAREIVSHAENEFASGVDIPDAFAPFARGGATTRNEAINCLKIVIADYYKEASAKGDSAMRLFEGYAKGSSSIALRILSDFAGGNTDSLDLVMKSSNQETVSSFVSFLMTIDPKESNYMNRVYDRIGVNAPEIQQVASEKFPNKEEKQKNDTSSVNSYFITAVTIIVSVIGYAFLNAYTDQKKNQNKYALPQKSFSLPADHLLKEGLVFAKEIAGINIKIPVELYPQNTESVLKFSDNIIHNESLYFSNVSVNGSPKYVVARIRFRDKFDQELELQKQINNFENNDAFKEVVVENINPSEWGIRINNSLIRTVKFSLQGEEAEICFMVFSKDGDMWQIVVAAEPKLTRSISPIVFASIEYPHELDFVE